jgi:hypothetical protein
MSSHKAKPPQRRAAGAEVLASSPVNSAKPPSSTPLPAKIQAVYSGRVCLGRIVCRGKLGFEAFDADERSLGIFPNLKRAADAVERAA